MSSSMLLKGEKAEQLSVCYYRFVVILTIIMQVFHIDGGRIYIVKMGKENTKSYL